MYCYMYDFLRQFYALHGRVIYRWMFAPNLHNLKNLYILHLLTTQFVIFYSHLM